MSIQRKRERNLLLLTLGVFAVVVINLTLFSVRFDLTSAGAWSISNASKAVFGQAKAPITVTYYLSKKLTTYYPSTQAVADFLDEYAAASGGKVKVKVVDPQDSGETASMSSFGIASIPIQVTEQNQQTQAIVYSGILIQYQERQDVLSEVANADTLEYDLTAKVSKLVTQKQKTVAFLTADGTKTLQSDFSILSQAFAQTAVFRQVQPGEPIGDATVLVVVGSRGFTPASVKPIDDYLMQGGKVFFAVEGANVDLSVPQPVVQLAGDNALLKALETWGVRVEQGLVNDDYNNIVPFNGPQGQTLFRYTLWPAILPANVSKSNPITSRFGGLSVLWGSPLTDLKKAGIQSEVLAQTSDKSWLDKASLTIDPTVAGSSKGAPGVTFGKQTVALALSGSFPSALGGQPASPATRLVVLGSGDSLGNYVQALSDGAAGNMAFVTNAVDWLAQDEGMLSIKTRTVREKSLTLLQDSRVRDAAGWGLTLVNLGLIPAVVLVWAVVRFLRRRAREQKS